MNENPVFWQCRATELCQVIRAGYPNAQDAEGLGVKLENLSGVFIAEQGDDREFRLRP